MLKIQSNVDLTPYSTYQVSSRAQFLGAAYDEADIVEGYRFAKEQGLPVIVLGAGSNVLFPDGTVRGLVLVNKIKFFDSSANLVRVGAGLKITEFLDSCASAGLGGFSFLAGIPGTVGGAVYGNAGAYGQTIGEKVISVRILTPSGQIEEREPISSDFSYRRSVFEDRRDIILAVSLKAKRGESAAIFEELRNVIDSRKGKHPAGKSCGSFFRNISLTELDEDIKAKLGKWAVCDKIPAAKLIDEAGCKGMRVGDAEVSLRHANFIMNLGAATSADIKSLADKVRLKVQEEFGVKLEEEVRVI